jgi:hypothetical protein
MLVTIMFSIFLILLIYQITDMIKNKENIKRSHKKIENEIVNNNESYSKNIDFYLSTLEDDYLYSYIKKTDKLLSKIRNSIKNESLILNQDLSLIKRIEDKYLVEILDKYLLLSKKQRKEERKAVVNSIKNINFKLTEIINEINERNIYDMTKSIHLSNGMLKL